MYFCFTDRPVAFLHLKRIINSSTAHLSFTRRLNYFVNSKKAANIGVDIQQQMTNLPTTQIVNQSLVCLLIL